MEIKYAHEMAAIAKDVRTAKRAKDAATARAYLEENLMKDIEDHAEKGENAETCISGLTLKQRKSITRYSLSE